MCIPIRHGTRSLASCRELLLNFAERCDPGELERTYLEAFHQLAKMIAVGTFPYQDDEVDLEQVPRVGDGMLVIDPESRIQYASPNALSTLHRVGVLGNVAGRRLEDIGIRHPAIKDASKRFRALVVEIERNDTAVQLMVCPSVKETYLGSLLC